MRNLKIGVRQENGVLSLKGGKQPRGVSNNVLFAYVHEKLDILLSDFSILSSFFFNNFNLNTQGFVYLELVQYQLGLQGNVQVFAKCNLCISAIQLFYIQKIQAFFLHWHKSYIFPMLGLAENCVLTEDSPPVTQRRRDTSYNLAIKLVSYFWVVKHR